MKVNITFIIRKGKDTLHTFEDAEKAVEKFEAIYKEEGKKHEHVYSNLNCIHSPYIVNGSMAVCKSSISTLYSYYLETKIEKLEK
ncbi:MAG: hypothetical protein JTJ18_14845 [Streptococcus sp.]|nr:hypothetical protein [Streptococcus sp.]